LSSPCCRPRRRWLAALPRFATEDFNDWVAIDVGIHWLGDPWGLLALPREDQIDLLAFRETLLANEQISAEVRGRGRRATQEDLRLLSMGGMTQGDYLHARLMMMPKGPGGPGPSVDPHQTSGAEQFAAILAARGGPAADFWTKKIREGGG